MSSTAAQEMPADLSPHRVRRRLIEFAAVLAVIVLVILVGPGLGSLRATLAHASAVWVVVAVGCEILSALAYVVCFRAVFCQRMTWRLSYQIGMSEQGANSVLSVSGAGGLALGAWALRRGGMSVGYIGRRTVAFFLLTSLANIAGVILFAALYALGILSPDPNPFVTYFFGIGALVVTVGVLALPKLLDRKKTRALDARRLGKLAAAARFIRVSLAQGIRDAVVLVRQRSFGVLGGSIGTMVFDMAVLWAAFEAFGHSPPIGVLALGYLIGQLGGNIPIPGGIGGLDAGLIGTFVLYHQPLAVTTAAVLVYHVITFWVPALLGSVAFVQLRRTLAREEQPAAMCMPLAEPIEVKLPARAAA